MPYSRPGMRAMRHSVSAMAWTSAVSFSPTGLNASAPSAPIGPQQIGHLGAFACALLTFGANLPAPGLNPRASIRQGGALEVHKTDD